MSERHVLLRGRFVAESHVDDLRTLEVHAGRTWMPGDAEGLA